MNPVTVKELKKHGKIEAVILEEDYENFITLKGRDELDKFADVCALHISTGKEGEIIEVTPVQKLTDDEIAVARLKFRRCKTE
jgi:hypothetical protein